MAGISQLFFERLQSLLAAACDDDLCALGNEASGCRRAEARRGARDECNHVLRFHILFSRLWAVTWCGGWQHGSSFDPWASLR